MYTAAPEPETPRPSRDESATARRDLTFGVLGQVAITFPDGEVVIDRVFIPGLGAPRCLGDVHSIEDRVAAYLAQREDRAPRNVEFDPVLGCEDRQRRASYVSLLSWKYLPGRVNE